MVQLVQIRESVANERLQFLILVAISFGVVTLTGIAYFTDRLVFQKFLGRINPLVASLVIVLIGGVLLTFFLIRGWFTIYMPENPQRCLWMSGVAALLAGIMVVVDLRIVFPEDLNVAFPNSVFYYPAVAYAAEILFHVVPLFILLFLVTSLFKGISYEAIIWPCIAVIALAEPVFQILPLTEKYPVWAVVFVAFHLWVFNMIQLALFKRYDFVSMYSFRLVYYLIWHIVWGYARTRLLF